LSLHAPLMLFCFHKIASITNEIQIINNETEFLSVNFSCRMLLSDDPNFAGTG
jgi:hypothetical protein